MGFGSEKRQQQFRVQIPVRLLCDSGKNQHDRQSDELNRRKRQYTVLVDTIFVELTFIVPELIWSATRSDAS